MIDRRTQRLDHLRMPIDQAADWSDLIVAAEDTPCQSAPSWWTSEDADYQRLAAAACRGCPLMQDCRDYGLTYRKERGVYGGLTEKDRRAAYRAARKQQRKAS